MVQRSEGYALMITWNGHSKKFLLLMPFSCFFFLNIRIAHMNERETAYILSLYIDNVLLELHDWTLGKDSFSLKLF